MSTEVLRENCSSAQEAHLVLSETGSCIHSVRMCGPLSQAGSSLSKRTEVAVGYVEKGSNSHQGLRTSMSDGIRFGLTLSYPKGYLGGAKGNFQSPQSSLRENRCLD